MRIFLMSAALVGLALATPALAQDPPPAPAPVGPCRDTPCRLTLDWGSGTTAANLPVDRRYGTPNDFEPLVISGLKEAGFRMATAGDGMLLTLRIAMKNAMCDAMPGTNTDMSCRTIEEVQAQWVSPSAEVKAPSSVRVTNRCGAGDQRMNIVQMAAFTAASIAYQTAPDRKGLKRPSARC
jgi:hypothetical protein